MWFKRNPRSGSWAEELGTSIHNFIVWGCVAAVLVPILIVVIILMAVI